MVAKAASDSARVYGGGNTNESLVFTPHQFLDLVTGGKRGNGANTHMLPETPLHCCVTFRVCCYTVQVYNEALSGDGEAAL